MKAKTPDRLAYSVGSCADAADVSDREVWRAIADGDLIAHKRGRRTLILHENAIQWLRQLPRLSEANKVRIRKPAGVQPVEAARSDMEPVPRRQHFET